MDHYAPESPPGNSGDRQGTDREVKWKKKGTQNLAQKSLGVNLGVHSLPAVAMNQIPNL